MAASIATCDASGERFTSDIFYSDTVITQGAFVDAVFTKNLTIENTVIRKEAIKNAIAQESTRI